LVPLKNFSLSSPCLLPVKPYLCCPLVKTEIIHTATKGINNYLKTKIREMNNYELMVIFTPVLSDEDYKAEQKKIASLVKANGGEVLHSNPWGLKSLAYPIAKKTTGLYWVMEYMAPSDFNEKLKIQLLRDEAVMRHMFTALDKYAVGYNAKKRSGVTSATEKAVEA
jgi:small subunit ribosomal protein S6